MENKQAQQVNTTEEETQKQSVWKRLDAFFDKHYAYVFAPVIVLVAYLVALFMYGVWPFGDKYVAASYDLWAQISPFIEHLFDVAQGKSSLNYSYAIAGGADVTGTFLYFFISPFSFLFLVFGEGMVAHASSIVFGAKLVTISLVAVLFVKKLFPKIPEYICVVVAIAYTYCGYTFVSCTYINWMDLLIYMPLAIMAFVRFTKTGKFWLFSLAMAACIYACFSLACFAMLTVFPVLICYGLLCVEKEKRQTFLTKLCLSFVVAVLMALPVMVSGLLAYITSGRSSGGLFDRLWYGFQFTPSGEIASVDKNKVLNTISSAAYRKWSYLLSDSVFLILTLVWLFKSGLKTPLSKFMLLAGIFTLLPVVVDESMLLLNMGSYNSYALRFGFLNAAYFLGGACLCLSEICFDPSKAYDGTLLPTLGGGLIAASLKEGGRYASNEDETALDGVEVQEQTQEKKPQKGKLAFSIILIALGVIATAFILWFSTNNNYQTLWKALLSDSSMIANLPSATGRYAHSEGALELTSVLFIVVFIVTFVGINFVWDKKVTARLLSIVLVFVVGAQLLFYNNQFVLGNTLSAHKTMAQYTEITTTLNELETDDEGNLNYFRIKDYDDKMTACAPLTANFNAFSVFSSVIDNDSFFPFALFGYGDNGSNCLKGKHGNLFGDCFLGYKYFLVHKDSQSTVNFFSYTKKTTVNGSHLTEGDFSVFENTLVFPTAYTIPQTSGSLAFSNPNTHTYQADNQTELYGFLYGKPLSEVQREHGLAQTVVNESTVRLLKTELDRRAATSVRVGAGQITVQVNAENADDRLLVNCMASKGYEVYVNGKRAQLEDNAVHFLLVDLEQGENTVEFIYKSPYITYMLISTAVAVVGLVAVAFVEKKTKLIEKCAPVISWLGIALATAVTAFFMLYPTVVAIVKLCCVLL